MIQYCNRKQLREGRSCCAPVQGDTVCVPCPRLAGSGTAGEVAGDSHPIPSAPSLRVLQAGVLGEVNACEAPGANADPSFPSQALPSIQIPVSPHIFTSISWATATSTLPSLSPVSPACVSPSPFRGGAGLGWELWGPRLRFLTPHLKRPDLWPHRRGTVLSCLPFDTQFPAGAEPVAQLQRTPATDADAQVPPDRRLATQGVHRYQVRVLPTSREQRWSPSEKWVPSCISAEMHQNDARPWLWGCTFRCATKILQQVGECYFFSSPFRRKVRGEAKKCRKVYGIEHRDQWCTACRWKKACQRFLD